MNHFTTQEERALAEAAVDVMVGEAIRQAPEEGMWVLHDRDCPLAAVLADAYAARFPWAVLRRWDPAEEGDVRAAIQALPKGTLVVLVQSANFRLNAFRLRLELFNRGLKTIEHVHLARMKTEEERVRYLRGVGIRPEYFTTHASVLAERLRGSAWMEAVSSAGETLRWEGGFEEPKKNVGDYRGMANVGGTFPIGEVFTEAKDIFSGSGQARVFAMADTAFEIRFFDPFAITVERGEIVLRGDEPALFQEAIAAIRTNERPLVREIGFGLNPAFGKGLRVGDVTAFERQRGMHISLGEKHSIYPKTGLKKREDARYHVDVFLDVERVEAERGTVYRDGDFVA